MRVNALLSISRERYVPPYAIALPYAGLEKYDLAMEWLDRCYEARDVHIVFLTNDPKWDQLRGNPRFKALLRRCGISYGT